MATPLYPRLEKSIFDAMRAIHIAQVEPWISFSQGLSVKRFDGRTIGYSGIAYEGSPEQVFWSRYIEPFLEDLTLRQFTDTVKLALEREVDARAALKETHDLLLSACRKTYRRMADIDQQLRGGGFPQSVPTKDWKKHYSIMQAFIDKHHQAELAMLKEPNRMERWYGHNKGLAWALGILGTAGVGGLIKLLVGS